VTAQERTAKRALVRRLKAKRSGRGYLMGLPAADFDYADLMRPAKRGNRYAAHPGDVTVAVTNRGWAEREASRVGGCRVVEVGKGRWVVRRVG